jgi:hypothetical protein
VKIVHWISALPRKALFGSLLLALILLFTNFLGLESKGVDFNTQVKPIFNKKCITCHGGVKVKGGFSMMTREDILTPTKSGKPAVIPSNANASELYKRVIEHDVENRMPYKKAALSEKEMSILHDWIEEGAKWGNHWAYNPIENPSVPKPKGTFFGFFPAEKIDWVKNEVDYFIYDKLKKADLTPSVQADKNTLLRRVSLDLIGMPASETLQQQFLNDPSVNAYEKLVDSLLGSPHFGERWTGMWLDLARYADTKGYEADGSRTIWRYRDWLIKAFNADMPYNQFLTEQLAGDLLPDATDEQLIATAFHRNTMTNDEGGTEDEEYRTAAVIDRVNTTWETLMGTTFACTQCHGHPYEPFKHEEYYQFLAFFNNTRDEDVAEEYPYLRHFTPKDSLDFLKLKAWLVSNVSPEKAAHFSNMVKMWEPIIPSSKTDKFINSELYDNRWLGFRRNAVCRLPKVALEGKNQMIYRYNSRFVGGTMTIHLDSVGGPVLTSVKVDTVKDNTIKALDFQPVSGVHDLYFTFKNPNLKTPEDVGMFFDWFHFGYAFPKNGKPDGEEAANLYWTLLRTKEQSSTPIMVENNADLRRETHVFERGNWMVHGEKVEPKVPRIFAQLPKDAPKNRLSLAQWLVDKKHPLTARTAVNRFWEQLFGVGLVETLEDMGSQGFAPTHPELLDYLAYRFMNEDNWSVKKLLKTMVMSATYRQDSKMPPPQYLALDPENKLYSRFSRVRLSAEQVRDQALQVSGLMCEKLYGESVMPFQPYGIWQSPWNGATWQQSKGENQYRRALYTYWKRASPYPSMMTFDGVSRVLCTARRIRTNTPLQALVTLNDSAYIDMARQSTFNLLHNQDPKNAAKTISKAYKIAIGKTISTQKLESLTKLYDTAFQNFKKDKNKMFDMLGNSKKYKEPEVAALVVVNNAIFNLDEFVTKN